MEKNEVEVGSDRVARGCHFSGGIREGFTEESLDISPDEAKEPVTGHLEKAR